MPIREISAEELKNLDNIEISLLQFYATWCGPCKLLKHEITKMLEEDNTLNVLQFDIDKDLDLARSFGIRGVPALFILKDNEIVAKQSGYMQKQDIENWIHLTLDEDGK